MIHINHIGSNNKIIWLSLLFASIYSTSVTLNSLNEFFIKTNGKLPTKLLILHNMSYIISSLISSYGVYQLLI